MSVPETREHDRKQWVEPPTDELRARRQWAAIERRLDGVSAGPATHRSERGVLHRFPSLRVGLAFAACLALLLAVGGGLWLRFGHRAAPIAIASTSSSVVLADGSRVLLAPGATFAVPTNEAMHVAAVLQTGGADFEVVPNRERVFTVVAEGIEVRVVGTAFHVDIAPDTHDVTVSVVHGIVEVRSAREPGNVRRLTAGQSFSTHDASTQDTSTSAPPSSSAAEVASSSALAEAQATDTPPSDASGSSASPAPLSAADDARALFDSANRARRGGDLGRAAALYRELCARHPDDPRAQVAALELARLEMEHGGDSKVAEGALKSASSANVGSSVHEDALARLVELYASKGNQKACEQSRAAYLAAYPEGVHAAQVRAACASR